MTSVPGSDMRRFDMGHKVQSMLAPFMHQFTFFQLRFYGLHLFNLYLI